MSAANTGSSEPAKCPPGKSLRTQDGALCQCAVLEHLHAVGEVVARVSLRGRRSARMTPRGPCGPAVDKAPRDSRGPAATTH